MKILKRSLQFFLILITLIIILYFIFFRSRYPLSIISRSFQIGDSIASYNGVVVYNNGMDYSNSHGKHYNADSSFYYGKQWQCVEFIKRYYFDHLHFTMPNGMGNAKDFFDPEVKQGKLNKLRGLTQYMNDENESPAIDDILIFGGKYGHVGIVTKVTDTEVEIIQQNIYMRPFETFSLKKESGKYSVGQKKKPNGWLRIPKENVPKP